MWYHQVRARLIKRLFPERARWWRRWKQHDPASRSVIPHERWSEFLSAYVITDADGVNRVRYGEVVERDRVLLSMYIADCERVAISAYSRPEQFAYWLNVYNAVTIRTILEHYPVRSVRNVGLLPSWLGGGPWDRPRLRVEGAALSLNDIEHRILRRNWRDPRIHYAINCGAVGCPNLPRTALRAEGLEGTLDTLATAFVNSPRGARFDGERLSVCRILSWFREDFGGTEAAVLDHLRRYATPGLEDQLRGRTCIDAYHYDWSLNDARRVQGS